MMARSPACHGWPTASYAGRCAAALCLICWAALSSTAGAAESSSCREQEHRFELIRGEITSDQLSSALFSAAETGCRDFAATLLGAGASLEARDRLGATPLAHAARAGQRTMVALFLAQGAQVDARDISGSTCLMHTRSM